MSRTRGDETAERRTDVKLWNSTFTWQKEDTLHSSDCEGKAFTAVGAKGKVVIIIG